MIARRSTTTRHSNHPNLTEITIYDLLPSISFEEPLNQDGNSGNEAPGETEEENPVIKLEGSDPLKPTPDLVHSSIRSLIYHMQAEKFLDLSPELLANFNSLDLYPLAIFTVICLF